MTFAYEVRVRKNMNSDEIRQSFFDFFKSKEHAVVPSSPVVLPADPTLLFTKCGNEPV